MNNCIRILIVYSGQTTLSSFLLATYDNQIIEQRKKKQMKEFEQWNEEEEEEEENEDDSKR